jgi:hypothetical protein
MPHRVVIRLVNGTASLSTRKIGLLALTWNIADCNSLC